MSEMLKNPRVLRKAQDEVRQAFHGKGDVDEASIHELKYLASVIKETLRLHPSLPLLLPRESRENCEIMGYQVPAKTKVIINAWAIGRDPKYWNEPETFYPERFLNTSTDFKGKNFEYIPFGAGRRMCPGILFALPNIELPLAKLLYHFDWKLPSGMRHENLDMTETFVVKVVKRVTASDRNIKLPPGPWKLPFIGNLHQLVGSLPHRILRDLANQHGPLMHLQLGEISTIVVSSPAIAKDVLITHGIVFAQRPQLLSMSIITYDFRDIGMAPYGNYWRQVRKICTVELLTAKQVQSFHSIRQEEVSALVKSISSNEGSQINLSDKIFSLTYGITSRAAFGNKCKDQETFSSTLREEVKLISGFSIADMYPSFRVLQLISGMRQKLGTLHQKSDTILQGIIDEHRERMERGKISEGEAKEDLVTVLLRIQLLDDLEFPLTDNNIKAVIWDIFSGGSETSSTIVDWAMSEMLKNPRVLRKAQDEVRQVFHGKGDVDEASIHELKYLASVIKETLRLHPSLPLLLPRESRENCEIMGYQVPVKTNVIINAWAIGRDPKYWNEPETFYPERFLKTSTDFKGTDLEYIPFGAGRRMCPGIMFALPNIELPLAKLLYHFDWNLPSGMRHENLDMTETFGVTSRRKDDLILIPTTHSHSSAA
ncbi:Cytochrome P450 71D10, putative [Theobroma cacao]|uniref:Cytochrome P450 71D10, putative n=1 Tax=Theobroma cacao TaxID=3641 RepID=S1S3Z3_THECC|nr:Cytochrome P450 71D10, putative [Theobroma cacao]